MQTFENPDASGRIANARNRAILETALDAIITIDHEGRTVEFNPAAERMFGYGRADVLGKEMAELIIPPVYRDRHRRGMMHFLATGEGPALNRRLELTALRADGQEFPVELAITQIPADGPPLFTAYLRDISDRRRAERQLELTRAITQSLGEGLYAVDRHGNIISVNPTAEQLLGWTEAELLNQNAHDMIHAGRPDGTRVPATECPLLAVVRTGTPFRSLDDAFIRRDGTSFPVAFTSAPIVQDGQVEGAIVAFRDITERKQAEALQARRLRQAALRADVGAILAEPGELRGVLQHCAEALVRHLDAAFARIWTLNEADEVLELEASAGLYTHVDGPHGRVPVGRFKIGLIAQERTPHMTNDVPNDPRVGDPAWARREGMVAFAGYPLLVEARVVGVVAMFARQPLTDDTLDRLASIADILAHGITRRRAEAEVRRLNESLERRVQDRTSRLAEANRELESFSYSVSHDLRAPLRHISGFVEMLQKTSAAKLDAAGQRYLKIILDAARHAGTLVDELLAFSRMGRAEMRFTPIDMNALVEEVRCAVEPDAEGRTIDWFVAPLPAARGDPAMLRLVLRNLLANAVKYTRPRAAARIEIDGAASADEVEYRIRDNGVGFDMQYHDKLFGVFQRLHTTDEFEGTGIGLANVRRIVQRHGGRTWAEGSVDGGATFFFTLPTRTGEGG